MANYEFSLKAKFDGADIQKNLDKIAKKWRTMNTFVKFDGADIKKNLDKVSKPNRTMNTNTKFNGAEIKKNLDMIAKTNKTMKVNAEIDTSSATKEMDTFTKDTRTKINDGINVPLKKTGQSLTDVFGKVLKFGGVTAVIATVTQAITMAWEEIQNLDSAVIDFTKVSNLSGESLQNYTDDLAKMGETIAKTRTEMISASAGAKQAGYSDADAKILGNIAGVYQNVADNIISAGDATTFLVSQLKAFDLEASDSEMVLDKLNNISNNMSVSMTDMATGLSKNAGAIKSYGNSMNETFAMLAAGTELMPKQAGKVSNGIKSIGAEIIKLGSEAGVLTYEMGGLSKSIELVSDSGKLLSTFDVLGTIKNDFVEMNEAEQANLALSLGMKTQLPVLTNLLLNWEGAIKGVTLAENAQGSAMIENSRFMEGLGARLNVLKGQFIELVTGGGITTFLKAIIDTGTALLKFANNDIGQVIIQSTALGLALIGITKGFALLKTAILGNGFIQGIIGVIAYQKALTNVTIANGIAVTSFGAVTASIKAVSIAFLTSPFGIALLIVGGITLITKVTDELTITLEEQKEIVSTLASEYDNLVSARDKLANQTNLTKAEENRLELLNAQITANEKLLAQEAQKQYNMEYSNPTTTPDTATKTGAMLGQQGFTAISEDNRFYGDDEIGNTINNLKAVNEELKNLDYTNAESANTYNDLNTEQTKYIATLTEEALGLQDLIDKGAVLSPLHEQRLDEIYALTNAYNEQNEVIVDTTTSIESQTASLQNLIMQVGDVGSAYDTLLQAEKDNIEYGNLQLNTYNDLMSFGAEYVQHLYNEDGAMRDLNDIITDVTNSKIDMMAIEQAMILIDNAIAFVEEGNALEDLKVSTDEATKSGWDFVYQQLAEGVLAGENTDALRQQIEALQDMAKSAKAGIGGNNGLAQSQRRLAGSTKSATNALKEQQEILKEQQKILKDQQEVIDDLVDVTVKMLKQQYKDQQKLYEDSINNQIKALEKLRDAEDESLKRSFDNQIDNLNKMRDIEKANLEDKLAGINKTINAQMDLLDAEKSLRNYQESISEKGATIGDLESQILSLSQSTSQEDIAKRLQLEEQLAQEKKDLSNIEYDREHELTDKELQNQLNDANELYSSKIENIQNEYATRIEYTQNEHAIILENNQNEYNQKIELLEEELEKANDVTKSEYDYRQEALTLIKGKSQEYYDDLIAWNRQYGDGIDESVTGKWNIAYEVLDAYNYKLHGVDSVIKAISSSIEDVSNATRNAISEVEKLLDKQSQASSGSVGSLIEGVLSGNGNPTGNNLGGIGAIVGGWDDDSILDSLSSASRTTQSYSTNNYSSQNNPNMEVSVIVQGNADASTIQNLKNESKKITQDVFDKIMKTTANRGITTNAKYSMI